MSCTWNTWEFRWKKSCIVRIYMWQRWSGHGFPHVSGLLGGHMASWLFVIDCIQPKLFLRVMSQFRASVVVKTTASNKSHLRQCWQALACIVVVTAFSASQIRRQENNRAASWSSEGLEEVGWGGGEWPVLSNWIEGQLINSSLSPLQKVFISKIMGIRWIHLVKVKGWIR